MLTTERGEAYEGRDSSVVCVPDVKILVQDAHIPGTDNQEESVFNCFTWFSITGILSIYT